MGYHSDQELLYYAREISNYCRQPMKFDKDKYKDKTFYTYSRCDECVFCAQDGSCKIWGIHPPESWTLWL